MDLKMNQNFKLGISHQALWFFPLSYTLEMIRYPRNLLKIPLVQFKNQGYVSHDQWFFLQGPGDVAKFLEEAILSSHSLFNSLCSGFWPHHSTKTVLSKVADDLSTQLIQRPFLRPYLSGTLCSLWMNEALSAYYVLSTGDASRKPKIVPYLKHMEETM